MNLPGTRSVGIILALWGFAWSVSGCSDDPGTPASTGGSFSTGGEGTGGDSGSGGTASGGSPSGGAPTGGSSAGGASGGNGSGGEATGGMPSGGSGGTGSGGLPQLLSETGLYASMETEELSPRVRSFAPQFVLWSDSADKKRWMFIPEGEQIDTTDMDNWTFPVGTKLWKEFSRDGVRVETRLLMRTREGGRGWQGVAYIWNEDQTDAVATPAGMENAKSTDHDVPPEGLCRDCHGDRADWPLGFSAVQLSYASDELDIDDLISEGLLSAPPSEAIVVPGTEQEKAVLGYMHSNCGSCHRIGAQGTERSNLALWLNVDQLGSVETTDTFSGLVNQTSQTPESVEQYLVFGGDPEQSELFRRITARDGGNAQMPPIGTEDVDTTGRDLIESWIESLPPPPSP